MFSITASNKLKKWFPKTLLSRFILIIIIPTIIGQLITVQLFYYRHWYNVSSHSSRFVVNEILELFDKIAEEGLHDNHMKFLNLEYEKSEFTDLPEFPKKMIEELEIFKNELNKSTSRATSLRLVNNDRTIELFVEFFPRTILRITIPAKTLINPSAFIFVLWLVCLGFALLTITLIFTKNQIRSILDLTKAAELYGRGNDINNFKPSGAKEIRRAGLAFLKMKDRIERQTQKRTQMLAMISHDLKTPLTRMKLQVELMEESDEQEEFRYDIDSMKHMIDSYLDFARGEGGEKFTETKLNSWLKNYLDSTWNRPEISYDLYKRDEIAMLKPLSFSRALSNLIENAVKYSTKIEVSTSQDDENMYIIIEDNGKGISDEEKNNVFKPFYRGDKSRSLGSSASVGLGLAIAREIIAGHYGSIRLLDSKKLGGVRVEVSIPKQIEDI